MGDRAGRASGDGGAWRPSSTGIQAARCRSSASPARTGRRRPRIYYAPCSNRREKNAGSSVRSPTRSATSELPASRTTPEAPDVQRMFRQMVDAGCGACVMEVSSHALALRRVDGTAFAAGVFTNLTRDHLDYHGDMESYFAAKRRLFEMLPPGAPRVINLDDPRGESLRKAADTVGDLRDQQAGRCDARSPHADLRRPRIRRAHAEGQRARQVEAGRATQCLQHARDRRDGHRAGYPGGRHRARPRQPHRSARTFRAGVVEPGRHHRRHRLRAHRRRAQEPARNGAAAGASPRHHRVRVRRRSGSHQAAADGRGCREAQRHRRDDVRQPAHGRSRAHHRGDQARSARRVRSRRRDLHDSSIARKRFSSRSRKPSPAIWCCSPAKGTNRRR